MRPFLTASWRNLLMLNFAADANTLRPYLPAHTEPDTWNNIHYVSLVGFLFQDTKVKGIGFPGHRTFEEVNLRFYVRYKDQGQWKRGVVFIRELVPKPLITLVANTLYKENYATHRMSHHWEQPDTDTLRVRYEWEVAGQTNFLKATASATPQPLVEGSEAAFITEHYWGYTRLDHQTTGEYEVAHPKWDLHPVIDYDYRCHASRLYGPAFAPVLEQAPVSALLANGSPIAVMHGRKLRS
ncbi:DUF2071 domain-containing protein [Chitinophaga varians]|uniref:DUF2071 domain-containing protein n=1 Tax=Chitinophaga varians TaxID=2202339 RepID=A0A847RE86_9BACT|nr:DUF2071 domain-containing protein [Chitinophaga varians]NLR65369.1 DUF2071 domain-containing protein [Chitinophaga varians]